jgi:hypothetical protein
MRPADPFGVGLDVLLPELPIVALGAAAEDVVAGEEERDAEPEAESEPEAEGEADAAAES